jgi:hypothetical protein
MRVIYTFFGFRTDQQSEADPNMPPFQLGNAASSFYLPCPELFNLFYCRNGGQCYGRFEETFYRQRTGGGKFFMDIFGGIRSECGLTSLLEIPSNL